MISSHTHLNRKPWFSLHGYRIFIPKIAAAKEYTAKHTVPELRNSSSCTRKRVYDFYHMHLAFINARVLVK